MAHPLRTDQLVIRSCIIVYGWNLELPHSFYFLAICFFKDVSVASSDCFTWRHNLINSDFSDRLVFIVKNHNNYMLMSKKGITPQNFKGIISHFFIKKLYDSPKLRKSISWTIRTRIFCFHFKKVCKIYLNAKFSEKN